MNSESSKRVSASSKNSPSRVEKWKSLFLASAFQKGADTDPLGAGLTKTSL